MPKRGFGRPIQVRLPPHEEKRIEDLITVGEFDSKPQFIRTAIRYYFRELETMRGVARA